MTMFNESLWELAIQKNNLNRTAEMMKFIERNTIILQHNKNAYEKSRNSY